MIAEKWKERRKACWTAILCGTGFRKPEPEKRNVWKRGHISSVEAQVLLILHKALKKPVWKIHEAGGKSVFMQR